MLSKRRFSWFFAVFYGGKVNFSGKKHCLFYCNFWFLPSSEDFVLFPINIYYSILVSKSFSNVKILVFVNEHAEKSIKISIFFSFIYPGLVLFSWTYIEFDLLWSVTFLPFTFAGKYGNPANNEQIFNFSM